MTEDRSTDPGWHVRGCPLHVHPTQRDPGVIHVCTCGQSGWRSTEPNPEHFDFIDVPVVDGVVTLPDGYTIRTTATSPTVRVAVPKGENIWAKLAAVGRQASGGWDADSLDAAWAEAEAALPEGGYVWLEGPYHGPPPIATHGYTAHAHRAEVRDGAIGRAENFGKGIGPTPAAALRALAAKLRNPQEG